MGEKKFDNVDDSIDSIDKDSDDLNIPEISEVPKFDEVEEKYEIAEEKRFTDKIMRSRPTTASIFNNNKDFDLPYPELFDRTERTFAACYAKFGDLSYFTAVQRIGCYMDYSSRLKRRHLNDIIQYVKHNTLPAYDEDEEDENFNENCLFNGLMQDEDPENIRINQMFNQRQKELQFVDDLNQQSEYELERPYINIYDPADITSEFKYPNGTAYSPALIKEMNVSIIRYKHYMDDPDGIRQSEISKFNKEWMSNALNLVYPSSHLKEYTQ